MPTPTNIVNDVISSQGNSPISGARKFSIKKTRSAGATNSSKLDASTLALADGSDRVYEDGLADRGVTGTTGGITITATIEGVGGTKPAAGSTLTIAGEELVCSESTDDNNAGELKTWTANYVQPPPTEE